MVLSLRFPLSLLRLKNKVILEEDDELLLPALNILLVEDIELKCYRSMFSIREIRQW